METSEAKSMTMVQQVLHQLGDGRYDDMPPEWQQRCYRQVHMFRRTLGPCFVLNVFVYCACLGVFIYMTVLIGLDYKEQLESPRSVETVKNAPDQPFPGMLLCNNAVNVSLSLDIALFLPRAVETGEARLNLRERTILNRFHKRDFTCPAEFGSPQLHCWELNATEDLTAFGSTSEDGVTCVGDNTLIISLNISSSQYGVLPAALGVNVHLFPPFGSKGLINDACQLMNRCYTSDSIFAARCSPPVLDSFFASSAKLAINLITLTSEVIEDRLSCGAHFSWLPSTTTAAMNPAFGDNLGIPVSDNDLVLLSVRFRSSFTRTVVFQSPSLATTMGSVGGWFGFLSDGWGVITLIFITEKLFVYGWPRHPWARWFERINLPEP